MSPFCKILFFLTLFVFGINSIGHSVPAYPKAITFTQKDGTTITIKKFGDEFFNYATTVDGYLISQRDGIYYYTDIAFNGNRIISTTKANDPSKRGSQEQKILSTKSQTKNNPMLTSMAYNTRSRLSARTETTEFPTTGEIQTVIILVNFKDVKFSSSTARDDFSQMLNTPNYPADGGTGSAKDYFLDNSLGLFNPTFVVYGPVDLPKNMAYYGANGPSGRDANPAALALDACTVASETGIVNFSQYDENDDGIIDNVFIYYAGYNEAESPDDNTIWPHKFIVSSMPVLNGKSLYDYACTSEFSGASGKKMAGIGTFAHEFGHVIGLADTYDTGSLEANKSTGLLEYDIMTQGSYNNEGRTPPYYMAYQRYQLKWMTPSQLDTNGEYTLENISENKAYIMPTSSDGEYFLLEYRNQTSSQDRNWDKYIGSSSYGKYYTANGLIITHIDKSKNLVGGIPAIDRWGSSHNSPNNILSHECVRLVYANGDRTSGPEDNNKSGIQFPGAEDVTSFTYSTIPAAIDWKESALRTNLSNIAVGNNVVTFKNELIKYSIIPSTNSLMISFMGNDDSSWDIKWKKVGGADFEGEITEYIYSTLTISELDINSQYEITIVLNENGETESFNSLITTKAQNNTFPTIIFDYEITSISPTFTPALHNYEGDYNELKWFINGVETETNYIAPLPLAKGEYKITCEIEHNGMKARIYKYLKVN